MSESGQRVQNQGASKPAGLGRTRGLIPFEPWFTGGLPTDEKLLPEYFRDAGYQTLAVGKWHLGPNELVYHPLNRGFDHFYGHLGGFINYNLHTIWRGVDWQRSGATVLRKATRRT